MIQYIVKLICFYDATIVLYLTKYSVQWTLTHPATMGPDHGRISEIAGYVNHHANRVYY